MGSMSTIELKWSSSFFDETFIFEPQIGGPVFHGRFQPSVSEDEIAFGHGFLPEGSLIIHQSGARKPGNILQTTGLSLVISKDLSAAMKAKALNGWDAFSVNVLSKKRELLGEFEVLRVKATCGPVLFENGHWSPITYGISNVIYWRMNGLYVDPSSAPGTDLFRPFGYRRVLVTARAAQFFSDLKIRGLELTSLRDFSMETANYRGPQVS